MNSAVRNGSLRAGVIRKRDQNLNVTFNLSPSHSTRGIFDILRHSGFAYIYCQCQHVSYRFEIDGTCLRVFRVNNMKWNVRLITDRKGR